MSKRALSVTLFVLVSAILIVHIIQRVQASEDHLQKGLWLHGHADHPREAEPDLLLAIGLNPLNSEAYFYLGQIYKTEGSVDDELSLGMLRLATLTDRSNCIYHSEYLDQILHFERYSLLEGATRSAAKCEFDPILGDRFRLDYLSNMGHALYVLHQYQGARKALMGVINLPQKELEEGLYTEPLFFYGLTLEEFNAPTDLICITYRNAEAHFTPEKRDKEEWLREIERKKMIYCDQTSEF